MVNNKLRAGAAAGGGRRLTRKPEERPYDPESAGAGPSGRPSLRPRGFCQLVRAGARHDARGRPASAWEAATDRDEIRPPEAQPAANWYEQERLVHRRA